MHARSDSEIIDLIGGTTYVARLCEVRPQAVSKWRRCGIPASWRKYLAAIRPDVFEIAA